MTTPITGHFILVNPRGLHLRPCARLIKIIRHYHLSIVHIKVGEKIAHKVTADALIVYARGKLKESLIEGYENSKEEALNLAGIKADSLIESFDQEKTKRGIIQYKTDDIDKKAIEQTDLSTARSYEEVARELGL